MLLPHGTGAQRKFRQTFTLSLPTGGHAQGVTFLADSRLTLSFGTYEFDALAAGAVESAAEGNDETAQNT